MSSSTLTVPFGHPDVVHDHANVFRCADITITVGYQWWTLRAKAAATIGDSGMDRPGPWLPSGICDVPAHALGIEHSAAPELFDWILATRDGTTPATTEDPTDSPLELPAIDSGDLAAQVGPFHCQGGIQIDGPRVVIDFPMADASQIEHLEAGRVAWLHTTLAATREFRMVRIGIDPSSGGVHARIDLTGCPAKWLGPLTRQAATVLRSTVEQLLPAINVLTDASVVSRALRLGAPAKTKGDE